MSIAKSGIVLILVLAIIESCFFYVVITSTINYHDGYTELTIEVQSYAPYTVNNTRWRIWYGCFPVLLFPMGSASNMYLTPDTSSWSSYIPWYATKGETYNISSLEIKVLDVQYGYVVIWVKPAS